MSRRASSSAPTLRSWIGKRALALGHSAEELGRLHHLRRAEDQLTVGNAITSMRAISASGGVKTTVVKHSMQRAPVFMFENALQAREFGAVRRARPE